MRIDDRIIAGNIDGTNRTGYHRRRCRIGSTIIIRAEIERALEYKTKHNKNDSMKRICENEEKKKDIISYLDRRREERITIWKKSPALADQTNQTLSSC